jgi:hypothetical protein
LVPDDWQKIIFKKKVKLTLISLRGDVFLRIVFT